MRVRNFGNLLVVTAVLGCLAGILSNCAGVVVGATATTATMVAQERGFRGGIDDAKIRLDINFLWFKHDEEMYRNVTLSISEGRVLLTGYVNAEKMRHDAVRLAWKAKGVMEVINEVQVHDDAGVGSFLRDAWINSRLEAKLAFDDKVTSINYSIDTVSGIVYLFGIAQDRDELQRVTNHANDLEYVRRVVNHVWLKSDPRRKRVGVS